LQHIVITIPLFYQVFSKSDFLIEFICFRRIHLFWSFKTSLRRALLYGIGGMEAGIEAVPDKALLHLVNSFSALNISGETYLKN
jgi:hypothetical protein